MSKQDFKDFLEKRSASQNPESEDRETRKREWLQRLDQLYELVEQWLQEYVSDYGVSCTREPWSMDEEHLGRYEAEALRIGFQGLEVWLEPVGAGVVGARGRVDMVGFAGSVRLVLVPADVDGPRAAIRRVNAADTAADYRWKLATPPPATRYVELDEDEFLRALMEVVNAGPLG